MRHVVGLLAVVFAVHAAAEEPLPNGWTKGQRSRWAARCTGKLRKLQPYWVAVAYCDCAADKVVMPRLTFEVAWNMPEAEAHEASVEARKVCAEKVARVQRSLNQKITPAPVVPGGEQYRGSSTSQAPLKHDSMAVAKAMQEAARDPAMQLQEWGQWFAEQCTKQGNGTDVCRCAGWKIERSWHPHDLKIYREGYRDSDLNGRVARTTRECTPGY